MKARAFIFLARPRTEGACKSVHAIEKLGVGELAWWAQSDTGARELLAWVWQSHEVDLPLLRLVFACCKVRQLGQGLLLAALWVCLCSEAFGWTHCCDGTHRPCRWWTWAT